MIEKIDAISTLLQAQQQRDNAAAKPAKSAAPEAPVAPQAATPSYGFRLRVDSETNEVIAVITDPVTHAAIREIPSKEMRTASEVIRNLLGPLVDKMV